MSDHAITWNRGDVLWQGAGLVLRPLHLAMAYPSILYLAAMTVFLFRPPDLFSYYADRIAFGVLVFFVTLRIMALRERIPFVAGVSLPMLGLVVLAAGRALREPFDAQAWSIIASKFIVPFMLFHVASLVFRDKAQWRHFEMFVLIALAYLVFMAIAFLINARSLIFPRFILDSGLGFHADRARGPFLQAVANGVSLNLLGIVVFALSQKRNIFVWVLWSSLPFAVLATMTRAVWISFVASALLLGFLFVQRRFQMACTVLVVAVFLAGLWLGLDDHSLKNALWKRTEERGPVDVRMAVYSAGWDMFRERPFTGWAAGGMYAELARRMEGYHLRTFYVHNTYLALLVEFGVPGFVLYAVLFLNLFRLGRRGPPGERGAFASLRKVWPLLLSVYLFNAFFVDMAYQFVIGLLFTIGGMLHGTEETLA